MDRTAHAPRRTPSAPSTPLDLDAAAGQLLAEARTLRAQRSARTLTPGAGAPVKQTLLALVAGQRLEEHPAPGPTTLQTLTGDVALHHDGHAIELPKGSWAACPGGTHDLEARADSVVLLTVAHTPTDSSIS